MDDQTARTILTRSTVVGAHGHWVIFSFFFLLFIPLTQISSLLIGSSVCNNWHWPDKHVNRNHVVIHISMCVCLSPHPHLQVQLQPEARQGCTTRPALQGDQVSMATLLLVPQASTPPGHKVAFPVWLHQGSRVNLDFRTPHFQVTTEFNFLLLALNVSVFRMSFKSLYYKVQIFWLCCVWSQFTVLSCTTWSGHWTTKPSIYPGVTTGQPGLHLTTSPGSGRPGLQSTKGTWALQVNPTITLDRWVDTLRCHRADIYTCPLFCIYSTVDHHRRPMMGAYPECFAWRASLRADHLAVWTLPRCVMVDGTVWTGQMRNAAVSIHTIRGQGNGRWEERS